DDRHRRTGRVLLGLLAVTTGGTRQVYDEIGTCYSARRQADPRLARQRLRVNRMQLRRQWCTRFASVILVATAFGAFVRGHGPAMADVVTWYDVLGIAPGASSETIRRAYVERTKKLEHAQIGHPPPLVIDAIDRGHKALKAAWLVLGDPARRECYDEETGGE